MKHSIYFIWLFLLGGLMACQDDDVAKFDVSVDFRKPLEFKPAPGGAIMWYSLPEDHEIYGVRVRYTNAFGEAVVRNGSYLSDSLILTGFTEAQQNVPAQLCFFNRAMEESDPIDITFDTEKSATMAVFDSLKVQPFWGGFNVTYMAPETVTGILHIFYIGVNPYTQLLDSILMTSVPIVEGGDTLNFVLKQPQESVDVIVRADEYKGYRVRQESQTIPCLVMDTLTPADFDFDFTGAIIENTKYKFGRQYLFDGDKNGAGWREALRSGDKFQYSTFMAGPDALGERFIIDLKEEKVPAAVNLYAYVYFGGDDNYYTRKAEHAFARTVWNDKYFTRLPCKVTLYGTNENPKTVALESCTRLYALDYSTSYDMFNESWAAYTDEYSTANYNRWGNVYSGNDGYKTAASEEEWQNAEPVVLNMLCNYSGAKFRYLFFVVEDTFHSDRWGNSNYEDNGSGYVTFNELEVCVLAE